MESTFTLHIRDPTGNSFVENPYAPKDDPALSIAKFRRSLEEMKMLGFLADDATELPEEEIQVGFGLRERWSKRTDQQSLASLRLSRMH